MPENKIMILIQIMVHKDHVSYPQSPPNGNNQINKTKVQGFLPTKVKDPNMLYN